MVNFKSLDVDTKVKKRYQTLEKIAHVTTFSRADLIHLGARGELKIWVLADGWLVELYGINLVEDSSGVVTGNVVNKLYTPYRISGPVQLYPETLVRIEADPKAKVTRFVAELIPEADQEYDAYEYRVCRESSVDINRHNIAIDEWTLVVFDEDLPVMMKAATSQQETPLGTRERRSLQLIIASLAHIACMDLKKPSKTATLIKHQMESMHEEISQKAIEDHLNKISPDYKVLKS